MLPWGQVSHVRSQASKRISSPRANDEQFAQLRRTIGDHDIFINDVALEMGEESVGGDGSRVQSKRSVAGFDPDMAQDPTLDVGDERLAATAGRQSLHVVGAEVVQELDAVRSG